MKKIIVFIIIICILIFLFLGLILERTEKDINLNNEVYLTDWTIVENSLTEEEAKLRKIVEELNSGNISNIKFFAELLDETEKKIDNIILENNLDSEILTIKESLSAYSIFSNKTAYFDKNLLALSEIATVRGGELMVEYEKIAGDYEKKKKEVLIGNIEADYFDKNIFELEKRLKEIINKHELDDLIKKKLSYYDNFEKERNDLDIEFISMKNVLSDLVSEKEIEIEKEYFLFLDLLNKGEYDVDEAEEKVFNLREEIKKIVKNYQAEEEYSAEKNKIQIIKNFDERLNIIYFKINEIENLIRANR